MKGPRQFPQGRLRRHRHAVGEARRTARAGLRQVSSAPADVRLWRGAAGGG